MRLYNLPSTKNRFWPNIKSIWFLLPFSDYSPMPDENFRKLTKKDLILKGSIIAIIVTLPSIGAFLVSWRLLDDLIQAAIIGAVVHFIAMGFSLKISKKFLVRSS